MSECGAVSRFEREFQRRLGDLCETFGSRRASPPTRSQPSLDFLLECLLEKGADPASAREYAEIHDRGKACPELYRRLRNAYAALLARECGSSDGLRLEPCDGSLACVRIVVPDGVGMDLPTILAPGVARTSAHGLLEHRLPYDLQSRRVPPHILEIYGGDARKGDNHALVGCQVEGGALRLQSKIASYGQIVDTCDCLTTEACFVAGLMRDWMGREDVTDAEFLATLAWRAEIHASQPSLHDVLLRPERRAAGIGLSVATVIRGNQEDQRPWTMLRARRGGKVGVHTDIYHVAPAGMMQHYGNAVLGDDHAMLTLLKESLEELFGHEEAQDVQFGEAMIIRDQFEDLFPPQSTTFRVLGVVIDLTNLRPEVCACATLDDQAASDRVRRFVRGNWEGKVVLADPWRDGPQDSAPQQWVQSGGACWMMATERLR